MIRIAAFKGIGWISDGIKLLTYSEYSHIALLFDEEFHVAGRHIQKGDVIEAWQGGVKHAKSLSENHTKGTPVDIFSFRKPLTNVEAREAAEYFASNIGKKYDYINIVRFVPIVRVIIPKPAPNSWTRQHVFCSELAVQGFAHAQRPLFERCKAWEIPPRDIPRLTLLRHDKTIVTE
ncbi:MAG: hypothetical protein KGL39_25435 [Patescibacteria group bacterium]|nr:hypothetical protein [Patescibacteria group bacterium]